MRLSKIRLSGFKSFVDATTLSFPGRRAAVVGPNGCGKSNVIDAVRWVLGESSAKNLRGDALTDVIFDGSSARRPVGQASIELVFDNTDGAIGGPYADYNEISVKRQASRDGGSVYYLNGTRCRRRDITEIFLGTGLGPRSYAIIEQDTITRLIEARPDELRTLLEEAAGVSRYKERRRETENRMRQTRDNLARVEDLREEVDKHLEHLQRQARAAEKYKRLREEQRRRQRELTALRWSELNARVTELEEQLAERENAYEAARAEQREVEAKLERYREDASKASESLSEIQQRYYEIGAEVSRLEQAIAHQRELRERQGRELEEVARNHDEVVAQIDQDDETLASCRERLAELEPALERARESEASARQSLERAEGDLSAWQEEWDAHSRRLADRRQAVEVDQTRLGELDRRIEEVRERRERLHSERGELDVDAETGERDRLSEACDDLARRYDEAREELAETARAVESERRRVEDVQSRLHDRRSELEDLRGRLSSLRTLQQGELETDSGVGEWLAARGLGEAPSLVRELEVEQGWERAVETVLGAAMEAVASPDLGTAAQQAPALASGRVGLYEPGGSAADEAPEGSLAAKLRAAPASAAELLNGVWTAADADAAVAMRSRLGPGESVATPEGLWLGRGWLRMARPRDAEAGMLEREQTVRALEERLEQAEREASELAEEHEHGARSVAEAEARRDQQQETVNDLYHRHSERAAELESCRSRIDGIERRREALDWELEDLDEQLEGLGRDRSDIEQRLADERGRLEELDKEDARLKQRRESLRQAVEEARQRHREASEETHRLELKIESERSNEASTRHHLERMQQQRDELARRREQLQKGLDEQPDQDGEQRAELDRLLERQVAVEREQTEQRSRLEEIQSAVRELEGERHKAEERAQTLRESLDSERLQAHEARVRRDTVREELDQEEASPESILADVDEGASVEDWEAEIRRVEQKIERLGAINLAAIDEYDSEAERKSYLDQQHGDLSEALSTLENAIERIDRDTRDRFKTTFDRVNQGLATTFPRLFRGGRAYLELTGDNLLDTGVTIMAQPPGKQNTNIHMLSGGEKALTAIALVFAIFELNPAPFCMLDEVDAPLDDTNVARFCELVQEMSERVQFVLVTHNKITMELADQLVGITMSEPGVSRTVAVDVGEAEDLAAS